MSPARLKIRVSPVRFRPWPLTTKYRRAKTSRKSVEQLRPPLLDEVSQVPHSQASWLAVVLQPDGRQDLAPPLAEGAGAVHVQPANLVPPSPIQVVHGPASACRPGPGRTAALRHRARYLERVPRADGLGARASRPNGSGAGGAD